MKQQIILLGREIEYTLRVSNRTRRIGLTVHPGGELRVTKPVRASQAQVERFILQKAEWVLSTIARLKKVPPTARVSAQGSKKEYEKHKQAALERAQKRLAHFNTFYKFKYNTITIRNQKTRWGSCSKKGNLNFNYKIALLPEQVADYLVVHELCHLGEFNHSPKFWALVAKTIPNYVQLRSELKKGGGLLV